MREKFFKKLAYIVTKHNGKLLLFCIIFTLIMVIASNRLSMKTQIADMMPKGIAQIEEYMSIIDEFNSAMSVMLTIESDEKDVDKMMTAADDLASKINNLVCIRPKTNQPISIIQRIALIRKMHPVKGIIYDTIPLVKQINYKINKTFVDNHAMMIQKTKDLENMVAMYSDITLPELIENINNNFEQEFIEDSDNMTTLDGEAQAVQGLESMRKFVTSIDEYLKKPDSSKVAEAIGAFMSGQSHFISSDNSMLMLILQPAVSMNEFEDAMYLGYRIDDTLSVMRKKYSKLNFGRSGAMMLQIDENKALAKDFGWPSLFALIIILILLVGSFRTWKNPLLSVITLSIALIWVSGMIAIFIHYITLMSASFGIVLIGLGIDFGIHFISGFRDGREQGLSVEDSIFYMYNRVGSGVVTGAMTTAIVFYCMVFTQFKAYTQMGITIGTGILTALIAMMLILPALIVKFNKNNANKDIKKSSFKTVWNTITIPLQFRFLEKIGYLLDKFYVSIIIFVVAIVLATISILNFNKVEFEYDMMELEPIGIPSAITQQKILDKFEMSPDFAMLRAKDVDDCRRLVKAYKKLGNKTGLIGSIDAITEMMPEENVQKTNIPIIKTFHEKISNQNISPIFLEDDVVKLEKELIRFHQNIVEIGELSVMSSGDNNKIIRKCDQIVGKTDKQSNVLNLASSVKKMITTPQILGDYQAIMGHIMKRHLLQMANTEMITLDNIPKDIKKRYLTNKSNSLLINIFPKGYIWEEKRMRRFNEATIDVEERITGMPMLMMLMIDLMASRGGKAVMFGAIAIVLFLLIDFRSIAYTVLATIPLAIGTIWMVGIMVFLGIKFNMVSFMALPLIIGIGIDDGVHILHRYRLEGPGKMDVILRFTGRAILLTSLTTMIGFGSMGLASHRGIASMGQLLFIGVGTCFIASAVVLPSLITIANKFFGLKK